MKRFVTIFFGLGIGFFLLPSLFPVFALDCPSGFENLCNFDIKKNPNIFGNIVQIFILIAIILSVIFLIRGGIQWIMSGGDKGKVEQARSAIIAAVVGLAISLLAYFIVNLVMSMLTGGAGLNSLKIPRLID